MLNSLWGVCICLSAVYLDSTIGQPVTALQNFLSWRNKVSEKRGTEKVGQKNLLSKIQVKPKQFFQNFVFFFFQLEKSSENVFYCNPKQLDS